jgi:hypothetical protein
MENHVEIKDGHVFANGTEISLVNDIRLHPTLNDTTQVQLSFKATTLDVVYPGSWR